MQNKITAFKNLGYKQHCWILGCAIMIKGETGIIIFSDAQTAVLRSSDVQLILTKRRINMTTYTKVQLEGKTSPELVSIYNGIKGNTPVKKFASKPKGVERILKTQPVKEVLEPKEKKAKAVDYKSSEVIKLTGLQANYQKTSVRYACFLLLKDGMTVGEYLSAASNSGINDKIARACLNKLAIHPTTPAVAI